MPRLDLDLVFLRRNQLCELGALRLLSMTCHRAILGVVHHRLDTFTFTCHHLYLVVTRGTE